jgi:polyphenol oxidase
MPTLKTGRRAFLAAAGAAGAMFTVRPTWSASAATADAAAEACDPIACANGTPFNTFNDTRPIKLRPTTDALAANASQLALFQFAFQRMMDFGVANPTDPRGWTMQAAIHGAMTARFSNGPAAVHNVHHGYHFLSWHRAYLYFLERILACHAAQSQAPNADHSIIDDTKVDPNFRMPCWNWDDTETNVKFPTAYEAIWFGDPTTNGIINPLWVGQRDIHATLNLGDDGLKIGMQTMLAAPNSGPGGFYGIAPSSTVGRNGQGAGENKAHNQVHNWVGGGFNYNATYPPITSPTGWMGDLITAARDPVFFAHHANIDKTWAWYRSFPYSSEPTDSGYLNEMWTFYDEKRSCWNVLAKDLIDYKNRLRYHYDPTPPKYYGPPPPNAKKGTFALTAGHAAGLKAPAGAKVGLVLSDVPYHGSGTFEIFARGAGGSALLGSFAITRHRGMDMGNKTDVFVLVSEKAKALINGGAKIVVQKVLPAKRGISTFSFTPQANATELTGVKATLFVH